ncbi:MAG: glycosyltransferase [Desulfobacteraceae bacterium]|nr:glycosyltransferase [Desulfobacteraceae bacterium]
MRIDFHVHSKFSRRPSQWILQKLGCPESFTEPRQLYTLARQRGMTAVTISDHNCIQGALEIADLPGTFVSEEITTYFPEDQCKIHVLALNIDTSQHEEIQRLRKNVFELVTYLNREHIFHIAAHPLYAVNDRLTAGHFEQMLLLFQNLELNGARNHRENESIRAIVTALSPERMNELAEKHDLEPAVSNAWQKRLFGGSDDHSSLNIARTHTRIEGAETPEEFFSDPDRYRIGVVSTPATPQTMAHNLYGIAYQFYRDRFQLDRYTDKDMLMRFLDQSLRARREEGGLFSRIYCLWSHRKRLKEKVQVTDSLLQLLRRETDRLIHDQPDLYPTSIPDGKPDFIGQEQKWCSFVTKASNGVMLHFADHLMSSLSGANVFNIFQTIGSAGGLYTMLAPYFVAFSLYSKDRVLSRQLLERFASPDESASGHNPSSSRIKIAQFTDTFYEVNGVALTLQQQLKMAVRNHKQYTVITCDSGERMAMEGICNFKPIGVYELPEYPEQKIFYPPLLEMLDYCYREGFTHIHTSTPGPIGLAALAIARILKLPIAGTYHTAIPQYAQILTGDAVMESLTWKYTLWYYDQLDCIYAPSKATRDELVEKGIQAEKIRLYPRGIDVTRFHPSKRNGFFQKYALEEGLRLLYVGRVSREKDLPLLVDTFRTLVQQFEDLQLVVVGDGPYLEEMKREVEGLPCLFTGYLEGEDLAAVYASSDLFVFPSATDTFGNVVLEAQASGLPVVVSDRGGPCENMTDGHTGKVVPAGDGQAWVSALTGLLENPDQIRRMAREARRYMEERSFDAAFLETWRLYKQDSELQKSAA